MRLPSPSPAKKYLLLCLAFFPLVVFFAFSKPWGLGTDFWDTAAAVRELSVHPLHPGHHLFHGLPGQASARFHPYTLFWGLFKRATGLDIFATMGLAGIANYLLFMAGLFLFISDRFKSRSFPMLVFLIMLWVWGSGYAQANAYHLKMFLITLPYVGFFAFGASLIALYFLNRFCERGTGRSLLFYALISVLAFVTHPITGLFCYIASLALLLEARKWKALFFLQSVPLLALGASLLWPYFRYGEIFTRNAATSAPASPLFQNQIFALGPALIGLPVCVLFAARKKQLFILSGIAACLLIYGVSFAGQIAIGGRFILFSAFFLHLAISVYARDIGLFDLHQIGRSFRSDGLYVLLIFVLLVVPGVYRSWEMAGHLFFDRPFRIHGFRSPIKPYLSLFGHLSSGDVVLAADWREAFPIPATTGARIVEPRHSFTFLMAEEAARRKKDTSSFFREPLSREERISLIKQYEVTHLLVNLKDEAAWHPSFREGLEAMACELAREGSAVLYTVLPGL